MQGSLCPLEAFKPKYFFDKAEGDLPRQEMMKKYIS
jgi:hypothetical protein